MGVFLLLFSSYEFDFKAVVGHFGTLHIHFLEENLMRHFMLLVKLTVDIQLAVAQLSLIQRLEIGSLLNGNKPTLAPQTGQSLHYKLLRVFSEQ